MRLQKPSPKARATCGAGAPFSIAAMATTMTAIEAKTKASGNQCSDQAAKRSATAARKPSFSRRGCAAKSCCIGRFPKVAYWAKRRRRAPAVAVRLHLNRRAVNSPASSLNHDAHHFRGAGPQRQAELKLMRALLQRPEQRLVGIGDGEGRAVDIPDDLRRARLDQRLQRDASKAGGRIGIAPDAAVVLGRGDGKSRRRVRRALPREPLVGDAKARLDRPGAGGRRNFERRAAIRRRDDLFLGRDLVRPQPFGQRLAARP